MKFEQTGSFASLSDSAKKRMAHAATGAIKDAAAEIKSKGRASIAQGGFSSRWQNALQAKVFPQGRDSMDATAFIYHKIPYAGVFEHGATISGKLWLPIEANLPLQSGGKRWNPHDFINNIGPLRPGKAGSHEVLFGQVSVGHSGGVLALPGNRSSRRIGSFAKSQKKWLPVFVAVTSVSDPKKFDIGAVVRDVDLQALFAKNWK
jgi:uncharacterized protein DUF6441